MRGSAGNEARCHSLRAGRQLSVASAAAGHRTSSAVTPSLACSCSSVASISSAQGGWVTGCSLACARTRWLGLSGAERRWRRGTQVPRLTGRLHRVPSGYTHLPQSAGRQRACSPGSGRQARPWPARETTPQGAACQTCVCSNFRTMLKSVDRPASSWELSVPHGSSFTLMCPPPAHPIASLVHPSRSSASESSGTRRGAERPRPQRASMTGGRRHLPKLSQLSTFRHAQDHLRVQTVHGGIGTRSWGPYKPSRSPRALCTAAACTRAAPRAGLPN